MKLFPGCDFLNFSNDKDVLKTVNNEEIYFSSEVIKINRKNDNQIRNLVITNKGIYNLKKKSLKRRFDLSIVQGITLSSVSREFVIHGSDEYDYHYDSAHSQIITEIIGVCCYALKKIKINFVVLPETNLHQYVTQKADKKNDPNFTKMNKEKLIDIDEYLYGNITKENLNFFHLGTVMKRQASDILFTHRLDGGDIFNGSLVENLKVLYFLSHTTYGKVFVAQYKPKKRNYLIRTYDNSPIKNDNCLIEVNKLNDILDDEHPFLSELKFVFKTQEKTFLVSEFSQFEGGYLFSQLNKPTIFNEWTTKFYISQIAMIIEYLHKQGITNINFIPENFLLDKDGYIKYVNFEIKKEIQEENKLTHYNKPKEYIAPEFLGTEINYKAADWYCLGVVMYEMLFGIPPSFSRSNKKVMFPQILDSSIEARDILEKLLTNDVYSRLGAKKGIEEIKAHPFFKGLDFDKVYKKQEKSDLLFLQQKEQEAQTQGGDENKEEITLIDKNKKQELNLPDVSNFEIIEFEDEEED